MSLLSALWTKFAGWIGAVGALLAILVGAFLKGRSEGKSIMQAEQDRHRREAIANKRKLDSEIDDLAPADLDQRLNRWVRPEDRG